MTTAELPTAERRRRLGLIDVFAIGVNAIVGSGVFSMPDDMYRTMGGFSPFAYLLCAIVLMPVALCFAELAGQFDETGGPYLYARKAFGPAVGFFMGFACLWNAVISFAANASLFVDLLGLGSPVLEHAIVTLAVALLGAINYVGVKPGAFVIRVMVVGKIVAILCFVAVAVMHLRGDAFSGARPAGASAVANGIYLALFPLQGFEVVPVPAGEAQNPRRSVPVGTVGSLLFAALLFVIVQAVIVGSYAGIGAESATPLVDAARSFGPWIGLIVLVGSIVSVGGFTAGSALGTPRYAQAMSQRGQLPSMFARMHPRFATPYVAIFLTSSVTLVLALFFDYRKLVGFSNVTVIFQYALSCIAVPVLRHKAKTAAPEPYREEDAKGPPYRAHVEPTPRRSTFVVPFGPVLPALGAIGSLALLLGAERDEFYFAGIACAIGAVCFFLFGRGRTDAAPSS